MSHLVVMVVLRGVPPGCTCPKVLSFTVQSQSTNQIIANVMVIMSENNHRLLLWYVSLILIYCHFTLRHLYYIPKHNLFSTTHFTTRYNSVIAITYRIPTTWLLYFNGSTWLGLSNKTMSDKSKLPNRENKQPFFI